MVSPSPLFTLCTDRRWDDAVEFLKRQPESSQSLLDTGKRGAAPISALQVVLAHAKCRGDVPLGLVNALLSAAPEMAQQKHLYTGNLPLHAVFYNAFFSASKRKHIAEMILRVCPGSITMKNNDGRTPLHTNCSQHCNHTPILTLLEAAPQTATWVDNNGDLPIHLACRSQKSPNKSIKTLYQAYPAGIWATNEQGLTPLAVARTCSMQTQKKDARISLLLDLQHLIPRNGRDIGSLTEDEDVAFRREVTQVPQLPDECTRQHIATPSEPCFNSPPTTRRNERPRKRQARTVSLDEESLDRHLRDMHRVNGHWPKRMKVEALCGDSDIQLYPCEQRDSSEWDWRLEQNDQRCTQLEEREDTFIRHAHYRPNPVKTTFDECSEDSYGCVAMKNDTTVDMERECPSILVAMMKGQWLK